MAKGGGAKAEATEKLSWQEWPPPMTLVLTEKWQEFAGLRWVFPISQTGEGWPTEVKFTGLKWMWKPRLPQLVPWWDPQSQQWTGLVLSQLLSEVVSGPCSKKQGADGSGMAPESSKQQAQRDRDGAAAA
jgi:hypothetical protein